ncbi:SpoIIIAH-like family protein [Oscillospiraceae bacterium MB08-C2-2]|nr:SpoIIIAH-like family protein [Oscillospiraceae bacterium MB08-C2-2]
MNMIIGKRQIILASLVLGLGVAVYLNWTYTNVNSDLPISGALEEAANYGEAQFVANPDDSSSVNIELTPTTANGEEETFFVEAKLSRQKARDEAVDTLAVMLQDAELDTDQRAELALRASDLANSIEVEGKIENLIKSKGFTDVMVYYDTQRADVILKTEGLAADQAAQIKDIILKETSITAENISIVEIN